MAGWISKEELHSKLAHKILIAGLSEAGKTAVKRIFFMKQKTEEVENLAATIDYDRMAVTISDEPIIITDLGGQRIFIKRFLNDFSPFIFSNVKSFLFVIDMAAKTTQNDSVRYFASCIEKLNKYSPEVDYYVFLHKNDLVRNLPNYESIHIQLVEMIQRKSTKKVHFFRTTIFKPKTVIDSFGRILEISIPGIAQSEYVDGRKIGEIEEYSKVSYSFSGSKKKQGSVSALNDELTFNAKDQELKLLVETSLRPTMTEEELHSKDLSMKLQSLVKTSLRSDEQITDNIDSDKTVSQSEIKIEEDIASKLENLVKTSLRSTSEEEKIKTAIRPQEKLNIIESKLVSTGESEIKVYDSEFQEQARYLMEFYGLGINDVSKLIQSGYKDTFESAARIGIPVKLLLNVFFVYLPNIKLNGTNISELKEVRLMEVFISSINDMIKESEVQEVLTYAIVEPKLKITDIIDQYIVPKREKIKVKEEISPLVQQKVISSTPTNSINHSKLILSDSLNIYLKISKEEIFSQEFVRLSFYQDIKELENPLVAKDVSRKDLLYLLTFEVGLPVENVKDFALSVIDKIQESITEIINSN